MPVCSVYVKNTPKMSEHICPDLTETCFQDTTFLSGAWYIHQVRRIQTHTVSLFPPLSLQCLDACFIPISWVGIWHSALTFDRGALRAYWAACCAPCALLAAVANHHYAAQTTEYKKFESAAVALLCSVWKGHNIISTVFRVPKETLCLSLETTEAFTEQQYRMWWKWDQSDQTHTMFMHLADAFIQSDTDRRVG